MIHLRMAAALVEMFEADQAVSRRRCRLNDGIAPTLVLGRMRPIPKYHRPAHSQGHSGEERMGMQSDFGRIIDALPGLVWTALPDGQADFLNQRWCEYTGLSTEQAIREGWQTAVHPDDLQRMLDYWL